jgi:hypothetical protein
MKKDRTKGEKKKGQTVRFVPGCLVVALEMDAAYVACNTGPFIIYLLDQIRHAELVCFAGSAQRDCRAMTLSRF